MRLIVFILLALAIGKVATQSYIRETATSETIIQAYRQMALLACARSAGFEDAASHSAAGGGTGGMPYFSASALPASEPEIELIIGRDDLDVRLWQTSHRLWSARYKDPFLLVHASGTRGGAVCEYDIKSGTARATGRNLHDDERRAPARMIASGGGS